MTSILSTRTALADPKHPQRGAGAQDGNEEGRPASALGDAIRIRVYNYARLDRTLLVAAEELAGTIFGEIHIETVWVDCALSERELSRHASCETPMGPADVILRILPHHMAIKLHASEDALGFAQQCPESEPACEATVFYQRVDDLATGGYRTERILGYAIAHELAHVLIGPGHSVRGIMHGAWSRPELQRMSLGLTVDFTKEQSSRLRAAVRRRMNPPVQQTFAKNEF